MSFWGFKPYVPVAKRRANALKEAEKLKKKGRAVSPVVIEGRKIAESFWGKAWCDNLERYSDYENRLPRGRTYVRNGSVIDLQMERGKVEALVSGSEIYEVKIDIAVAAQARWKAICADCAGSVASIVELLQGKLSKHVMERVCREGDGLFPAPKEIKMSCSCPDGARMCKHVAATLYGVGARLDSDPDLMFTLRGVNRSELVSTGADVSITEAAAASERVLVDDDMAALFGLEIEAPAAPSGRRSKAAAEAGEKPAAKAAPARTLKSEAKPEGASVIAAARGAEAAASARARPAAIAERAGRSKAEPDRRESPAAAAAKPEAKSAKPAAPTRGRTAAATARVGEKPSAGRTRAGKWIGARKARTR